MNDTRTGIRGRSAMRRIAVAAALAVLGGLLVPATAHAAEPILDDPITLDRGHIDAFFLRVDADGAVQLALSDDATLNSPVLRTPESVELLVKSEAQLTFSATAPWVPSELRGREVYSLPLSQNSDLIWPGWDTNELKTKTDVYGGSASTDFAVSVVEGPGDVWIWTQDAEGPVSLLKNGGYRLSPTGTIVQSKPAHTHAAWAFTESGTYKLRVRADVSGNGNSTSSNTATYTFEVEQAAAEPLTGAQPTVSGTAQVGKKLTAKPGTWSPRGVALRYQWLRNGKPISKATKSNYTATPADVGKRVGVRVTGTLGDERVTRDSAAKKVAKGKLTAPKPTISGTAKVGKTLKAKPGTWKPKGTKLSYQWYANGKKISKATKSSYRIAKKYRGERITVRVTGKQAGYSTAHKTSSAKQVKN
ncbi:MAG: choice-of-anchor M domain-containing protein [Leucobacter sp.]